MSDLIERLKQAKGGDRELDAEIALAIGWSKIYRDWDYVTNYGSPHWEWFDPKGQSQGSTAARVPAYTSSLDAAVTLIPKEWHATINYRPDQPSCVLHEWPVPCRRVPTEKPYVLGAATPALALCIASLLARGREDD